jgi:hypothetical protein
MQARNNRLRPWMLGLIPERSRSKILFSGMYKRDEIAPAQTPLERGYGGNTTRKSRGCGGNRTRGSNQERYVNHDCCARKIKAETVRDEGRDIGANIDPCLSIEYNMDKDFNDLFCRNFDTYNSPTSRGHRPECYRGLRDGIAA